MEADALEPHWAHIQKVLARPSLYLSGESFEAAASYLSGYNDAWGGALLKGFREWLVLRANHGANFAWEAIVGFLATDQFGPIDSKQDRAALDMLAELLREFVVERGADIAADHILASYNDWLGRRPA